MKYHFLSCFLTFAFVIVYLGTMTACALKLFRNCVALEKDLDQVNFIKMRIHGIWDYYLEQDQEVGEKHINAPRAQTYALLAQKYHPSQNQIYQYEQGESRNWAPISCFNCNQPGHYATQSVSEKRSR